MRPAFPDGPGASSPPAPWPATPAALARAAAALGAGGVIGVPTDTVYGLAALATSPEGCARLFALKGRPGDVALPVLVGDLDAALSLCAPAGRERLGAVARALWPGALTLVVEAATSLAHLGGDGTTIGLRFPGEPVMAALCRRAGPLAVTSANAHGAPPCTSAEEVAAAFPVGLAGVLDAGVRNGTPSSVVSLVGDEPTVLRAGPVAAEAVSAALAPLRKGEGHK